MAEIRLSRNESEKCVIHVIYCWHSTLLQAARLIAKNGEMKRLDDIISASVSILLLSKHSLRVSKLTTIFPPEARLRLWVNNSKVLANSCLLWDNDRRESLRRMRKVVDCVTRAMGLLSWINTSPSPHFQSLTWVIKTNFDLERTLITSRALQFDSNSTEPKLWNLIVGAYSHQDAQNFLQLEWTRRSLLIEFHFRFQEHSLGPGTHNGKQKWAPLDTRNIMKRNKIKFRWATKKRNCTWSDENNHMIISRYSSSEKWNEMSSKWNEEKSRIEVRHMTTFSSPFNLIQLFLIIRLFMGSGYGWLDVCWFT